MFSSAEFSRQLWQSRKKELIRCRHDFPGEFIRVGNAEIRVLVSSDPGAGLQTLVVVPDPPNVIEHLLPLIAEFSKHVRVVAFELPGFGYSYPDAGFKFDISSQTTTFEALFRYLNINNAVLDISCLGAYVGINFAHAYPERVHRLMLQQVPNFKEAQIWAQRADLWGLIRTPWIGQLFMRYLHKVVANHWYHSALPATHDEEKYQYFARPAIDALTHGGCFCLADAYQTLLAKSQFTLPVLKQEISIIWGGADKTHALTSRASLLKDLPKACFHEFSNCGHFPSLEAPELYYPFLRDALA